MSVPQPPTKVEDKSVPESTNKVEDMSVHQPVDKAEDNLPPELNALISEEVLRARVEKILGPRKPENIFQRNKDQLLMLLFGFFLTWGIGTHLTNRWEQSRLEATRMIEQERRETDARIVAFTDFLGTISEQHARSSLVDEAFRSGAPISELAALVKSEEEIFAKSQNKTGVLTFTIRKLMPSQDYEKIKTALDGGLVEPLRRARINHGYMYYEVTSGRTKDWKYIAGLSPQLSDCSAALTNAIWYNAIALPGNGIPIEKGRNSLKEMEEACKDSNR